MARNENTPFGRGETFYNGATPSSTDLGGLALEGVTKVFEDLDYSVQGAKPTRSNYPVTCMCVRNMGSTNILPKRLVRLIRDTTLLPQGYLGRTDGYSCITGDMPSFPVDEWLPAAGVPQYDLFWVVVDGPATVLTDLAGGANNPINVNDILIALTAATLGATTAGRVVTQVLTGATAVLAAQIQGGFGRALSAATTSNTNASILALVTKW